MANKSKAKVTVRTTTKKKKSSVKSSAEYAKELDNMSLVVDHNYETSTIKIAIQNVAIHPYIRHRKGKFGMYDPLDKYKKILATKLKEIMKDQAMDPALLKQPIKEKLTIYDVPTKTNSITKIYYMLKNEEYFIKKPDVDNYAKTFNDIINMSGVFWQDDCQIYGINIEKHWAAKKETVFEIHYEAVEEKESTIRRKDLSKQDQVIYDLASLLKHGEKID